MTDSLPARRLLLVHAHPDDEVTGTGATMASYVAAGAHVTLVTCTLGEEGEIHVPELAGLPADRIHEPWRAPGGLPPGYPDRIVDHAAERAKALADYESVRAVRR